ncbi:MAG: zinc ribbon domain-containing protein [Lachnospiraceae bacterium]|nr:zinc ribbon domain-containing protein [Lachnospiraceae bacterium]
MALFDQLGKKFSDFSQDVANQSKTLADISKWNQSITKEENKISELYRQLGEQYYHRCRAEGTTPEADTFLFASVDAAMEQIHELKDRIAAAKGHPSCPRCGARPAQNAKFCPFCGSPMNSEVK